MKKILSVAAPVVGGILGGPLGVMAGGALGSAITGADTAKQQANAQLAGIDKSNAIQMQMFERGLELNEPFRQAGISALPELQQAATAAANPFSFDYSAYFNSPEYAALSGQAQQSVLAGQSATGGLRSGNSQTTLASIAPQLAQQGRANAMGEYSLNQASMMDRYNRLMGLTGVGQGATQQGVSQSAQVGQGLSSNALQAGNVNANKYGAYGNAQQGLLSDAISLFAGRNAGLI